MRPAEIEAYRKDLCNILNEADTQRHQKLVELAKKVGAGYVHSKIAGTHQTKDNMGGTETLMVSDQISETELVLNINNALQTETMINALKTANRSWIVALIAAVFSVFSIVVSIVAVILKAC